MASRKAPHFTLRKVHFHNMGRSEVLLTYISKDILSYLCEHMYDTEPHVNHLYLLTKAVTEKYLQVRCHYTGIQPGHCHVAGQLE